MVAEPLLRVLVYEPVSGATAAMFVRKDTMVRVALAEDPRLPHDAVMDAISTISGRADIAGA